jgi:hypothetical protein
MRPNLTCIFLACYTHGKHAVAVDGKPDLVVTDEPVNLCMVGEIMGHHQALDAGHVREHAFPVDRPSVDGTHLHHAIRITGGQVVRGAVLVHEEARYRCINGCSNPAIEVKQGAAPRIAVILQGFVVEKDGRLQFIRYRRTGVRDGEQERICTVHWSPDSILRLGLCISVHPKILSGLMLLDIIIGVSNGYSQSGDQSA